MLKVNACAPEAIISLSYATVKAFGFTEDERPSSSVIQWIWHTDNGNYISGFDSKWQEMASKHTLHT